MQLKRGSRRTLGQVFARPTRGTIRWKAIEALLLDLEAELTEREDSRIGIYLFEEVRVFHRPHPYADTDKGAVTSIRNWLKENGIEP